MVKEYSKEELEKILDKLFNQYGKRVYEPDFGAYFKAKGFTDEEVDKIWLKTLKYCEVETGARLVEGKVVRLLRRPENRVI